MPRHKDGQGGDVFWMDLLSGGISGIAVAVVLEAYTRARRRLVGRHFKRLVGFPKDRIGVIAPKVAGVDDQLIGQTDTYTISYCLAIAHRVGLTPVLSSVDEKEGDRPETMILVGGPTSNWLLESMLEQFCPGYRAHGEMKPGPIGERYYTVGQHTFKDDARTSYAFLVKLDQELTGLPGCVLLLWGHTGRAGMALAYDLMRNPKKYSRDASRSSFLVLTTSRDLGHRQAARGVRVVTEEAFLRR